VKEECGASKRDDNRKALSQACDIYPELFIKFKPGADAKIIFRDVPDHKLIVHMQNEEIHALMKEQGFERATSDNDHDDEPLDEKKIDEKLKKLGVASEQGSVDRPAEAEPEYESPTADETTKRSNKRTETSAPDPSDSVEQQNDRPAESEPEHQSPTADETTKRSNKRTETSAPDPSDKKNEL